MLGQTLHPRRPGRGRPARTRRTSNHASGPSSDASCSRSRWTRGHPSGASTSSSSRSSARSRTGRSLDAIGGRATWPPPATSSRSATRSSPARSRRTTSTAHRRVGAGAGGGRRRDPGAPRAPRPRPSGPRRSGAHDQAIAHLEQALEVTSDPAERVELLLRAARSADVPGRATPKPSPSPSALSRVRAVAERRHIGGAGAAPTSARSCSTPRDPREASMCWSPR